MAVPRSKRKESSMQYIDTWRRACAEIFRFSNRLPKRYAFRMANPLCQYAYEGLVNRGDVDLTRLLEAIR